MNESPDSKLYSLRVKTDRELEALIGKTLDRGVASARELDYEAAEKAYEEARAWLALVARREGSRLGWRLELLRRMLDEAARDERKSLAANG